MNEQEKTRIVELSEILKNIDFDSQYARFIIDIIKNESPMVLSYMLYILYEMVNEHGWDVENVKSEKSLLPFDINILAKCEVAESFDMYFCGVDDKRYRLKKRLKEEHLGMKNACFILKIYEYYYKVSTFDCINMHRSFTISIWDCNEWRNLELKKENEYKKNRLFNIMRYSQLKEIVQDEYLLKKYYNIFETVYNIGGKKSYNLDGYDRRYSFKSLSSRMKDILELYYFEGKSVCEIKEYFNFTEKQMKEYFAKSRKKFTEALEIVKKTGIGFEKASMLALCRKIGCQKCKVDFNKYKEDIVWFYYEIGVISAIEAVMLHEMYIMSIEPDYIAEDDSYSESSVYKILRRAIDKIKIYYDKGVILEEKIDVIAFTEEEMRLTKHFCYIGLNEERYSINYAKSLIRKLKIDEALRILYELKVLHKWNKYRLMELFDLDETSIDERINHVSTMLKSKFRN